MTTSYRVIARKYRPQTFKEVYGQESIVLTLKRAIEKNQISHAYLFSGIQGTGKTTLARLLAKALNCENRVDGEPCNKCPSCHSITEGHSLDVLEIDGASNRGIDDIRQLGETISYTPSSKYKIYIIDEVHMLTKEAFNALLKTLEEPPSHVKFFFATTEIKKVLPTILSRCQHFELKRLSIQEIANKLQTITKDMSLSIDEEAIQLIAKKGEGSLRDAESLMDQMACLEKGTITEESVIKALGLPQKEHFFSLDKAFKEGEIGVAFSLAEKFFLLGSNLFEIVEEMIDHFRSHLLLRYGEKIIDEKRYQNHKGIYQESHCLDILDTLFSFLKEIPKQGIKKAHLEMLLLKIIQIGQEPSLENIVSRLISLEKKLSTSPPLEKEKQMSQRSPQTENKHEAPLEQTTLIETDLHPVQGTRPPLASSPAVPPTPSSHVKLPHPSNTHEGSLTSPTLPSPILEETKGELPSLEETEKEKQERDTFEETLLQFSAVELQGTIKKHHD